MSNNNNNGLGLVAEYQRKIRPGNEYDHLIPKPDGKNNFLADDDVDTTVKLMARIISDYIKDTEKLAPALKGKSVKDTLKNVYEFIYWHIQYNIDTPGKEQLRRPARAWADRVAGVDCDCYTIFIISILLNMIEQGILPKDVQPKIRLLKIPPQERWHHVYAVVMHNGRKYTIDPVLDKFDYEKKGIVKDYDMTQLGLGMPIYSLTGFNGRPSDSFESYINQFTDIDETDPYQVLKFLKETKKLIEKNPESIEPYENSKRFLTELDYAIKYFDTPYRNKALKQLAANETLINEMMEGINPADIELMDAIEDETTLYAVPDKDKPAFSRILLEINNGFATRVTPETTPDQFSAIISDKIAFNKRRIDYFEKLDTPLSRKLAVQLQTANNRLTQLSELPTTMDNGPSKAMAISIINDTYNDTDDDSLFLQPKYYDLLEDVIDDIENYEDDAFEFDIKSLSGTYNTLGAFWHSKDKRLKKKRKRLRKRLKKCKTSACKKRLELKIEKNNMKLAGTWKKNRKQWRKKNKRGFWNGVNNLGKGAWRFIKKTNPALVLSRNGYLLALKLNVKKMAARLKWGYATKEQARKNGISEDRWNRSKRAVSKAEDIFYKLGGSPRNVKKAVLKGKAGGLNGIFGDLGAVTVASAATLLAAAAPLIIKLLSILKKEDLMDDGVAFDENNWDYDGDVSPYTGDDVDLSDLYNQQEGPSQKDLVTYGLIGVAGLGLIYVLTRLKKRRRRLPATRQPAPQYSASPKDTAPKKPAPQKQTGVKGPAIIELK